MKKSNVIYIICIIFYVLVFFIQINQPPFERYPGWDRFWGNVLQGGKLIAFKHALLNFELPNINPYIDFGFNNSGDTTLPQSFMFPLNFLILLFSPDTVIMLKTIILMMLAGIAAYLYLNLLVKDKFLSFLCGISYISIPYVIGINFYYSILNTFCFIPLILFLIHKIIEQEDVKKILLFVSLCIFTISSGDVFALVIVPTAVMIYTFFIASSYYQKGWSRSLKSSMFLTFLSVIAGSFYIIPLYDNLHTILSYEKFFRHAGFVMFSHAIGIKGFLKFFYIYAFQSLFKPNDGSGLLLYIPAAFNFVIIFSILFKRLIFKNNQRLMYALFILVLIGFIMVLMSLIFYCIPMISEAGKGVFRYQVNLIPFLSILAVFICLSAITKLSDSNKLTIFILILLCSLAVDTYLFIIPHKCVHCYNFFDIRHELLYSDLRSSNLMPVRFSKDMWPLLPLLNILPVFIVVLYSFYNDIFQAKKGIRIIFVFSAMIIVFLTISVHNELRLQQDSWQVTFRNPYRWNSYLERKHCIDSIINRHNINYRTLYVGKNLFGDSGRNWKLIGETELNVCDREKVLFSYRETTHPYSGLVYSPLSGYGYCATSALMPPLSSKVADNIDSLKLMGVKYVISADEKIQSQDLIYKGECITQDSPYAKILGSDGGPLYIYELRKPFSIAFLLDSYKKVDIINSLRSIWENKKHPWVNDEVYLEEDPIGNGRSNIKAAETSLRSLVEIKRETFNTIELMVDIPKEKYLVLSYLYRPNWKAFIEKVELKIYRAYGGFMCVKVPAGNHIIKFRYIPRDVYLGLVLTLFAFIIPLMIRK